VESLVLPKGPNGGYGHFIGVVLILAISSIALIASTGAALQHYRWFSLSPEQHPRWFSSALSLVGGFVVGAAFIGALVQPAAVTALTYTNGVPTVHISAGAFDLTSVSIAKGSKLLLIDDTTSLHTLVNGSWQQNTPKPQREAGAPLVNNLSLSGNSVTIGPFTTAGTYHIMCILHKGMNLTITVQ
jgi:plastocyanin